MNDSFTLRFPFGMSRVKAAVQTQGLLSSLPYLIDGYRLLRPILEPLPNFSPYLFLERRVRWSWRHSLREFGVGHVEGSPRLDPNQKISFQSR
jgi:hypothetical protein